MRKLTTAAKLRQMIFGFISFCEEWGYIVDRNFISSFAYANDVQWSSFKRDFLNLCLECSEMIERQKKAAGIVTTSDLIKYAVQLLSQDYIAHHVASEYKYLFIDEFQDTNQFQFNLVKILIENGVNVFLVGDEKQSIYGFRGADSQNSANIEHYIAKRHNKGILSLRENYRSDKNLIDEINAIFENEFSYNDIPLNFPKSELVASCKTECDLKDSLEITYWQDIEQIIETALNTKINGKKARYEDIAVLCRWNNDAREIAANLKRIGIPFEIIGATSLFQTKEVIDTYKILNSCFNTEPAFFNELFLTDYYKAFTDYRSENDFICFLSEFKRILYCSPIGEALSYLYDKTMIMSFYKENSNFQAYANLLKLSELLSEESGKEMANSYQVFEYLHFMIIGNTQVDEADVSDYDFGKGVVKIYTIHRAKGLSFPIVIIPNIDSNLNRIKSTVDFIYDGDDENRLAFNADRIKKGLSSDTEFLSIQHKKTLLNLEEEIRVFYVACTRAEHKLILAASNSKDYTIKSMKWDNFISIAKWIM